MINVHNVNIGTPPELVTPEQIRKELPLSDVLAQQVYNHRKTIENILLGRDRRFIVFVGPCSIYDKKSALEYAKKLLTLQAIVGDTMFLVMRAFFAKPRSTVGWKGLIYDPGIDGSYDINHGIRLSRDISLSIVELGLPIATEMLDAFTIEYLSDIISWAAVGARTSESQTHREAASGLSAPVGIKNSTDGNVDNAIDGVIAVNAPHRFWGILPDGRADYLPTKGNKLAHIVMRGGRTTTNYDEKSIQAALAELHKRKLLEAVVVDCSHGNSEKIYTKQRGVFEVVLDERFEEPRIVGAMLESNLVAGKQEIPKPFDPQKLVYGQSITDGCLGWDETERLILEAHELLLEHLAAV